MKVFKIEEIDHEKFRKESMWAIKINKKWDKDTNYILDRCI
jgi:hypothetical protein